MVPIGQKPRASDDRTRASKTLLREELVFEALANVHHGCRWLGQTDKLYCEYCTSFSH